jgi:Cna protein B-type domain.
MKKILRNITVIFMVSFAYPIETVSIQGEILDSDGKPVKKAEIELTTAKKKKIDNTKSDKKGKFSLENLKAQDYYLNISSKKKGSATVFIEAWDSGNIDIKDLKITLSKEGEEQNTSFGPGPVSEENESGPPSLGKGGAIETKKIKKRPPKRVEKVEVSGKVVNKKGKPVKKAKVILIDDNYNAVEELETDKEGLFII